MSKRAASIAALAASATLIGAGWLAAASLAGAAELEAAVPVPGTLLFTDATGEDPAAPDIHRVWISNSAGDEITVQIEITNFPTLNEQLRVGVFLDTDRDDATGRPSDGADYALAVYGAVFPRSDFVKLLSWSDGAWQEVASTIRATYRTSAPFGPEITVPRAEIANTAGFDVVALAEDILGPTTGSDRAPDAGQWTYPLTFPETTSESTTTTETTTTDGSTSTTTTTPPPTTSTTPPDTTTTTPPPTTSTTPPDTTTTTPSTTSTPTTTTTPAPPATTTVHQTTTTVVGMTTTVQQTTTVGTTTAGQPTTTVAAARRVDRCPNIRGLQAKVPSGMVKRNGKCVSRLSLAASGLVKRPSRPTAGQQFAVGATILNRKTKKGLPSAAVSCPAFVGDTAVVARKRVFDARHSAAYCYWMIPASARGAVLQAAVVATYQGAQVRRWLKLRVG